MKIQELLDSPEKWIKGNHARDNYNNPIHSQSPYACKWCLVGAFVVCYPKLYIDNTLFSKLSKVIRDYSGLHNVGIAEFNDLPTTTFADIRKVIELADV